MRLGLRLLLLGIAVLPLACSSTGEKPVASAVEEVETATQDSEEVASQSAEASGTMMQPTEDRSLTANQRQSASGFYQAGDGRFVNNVPQQRRRAGSDGDITLNFEGTSIAEVVKVILGDILGENYIIDPKVQGSVTLQTSRPIPVDALLSTLELLLGNNQAALIRKGGLYQVVPANNAARNGIISAAGSANGALPAGYQVQVVPLRYIAVEEMEKILAPLSDKTNILKVDKNRNLLILAGTVEDLRNLSRTINTFDVDWLAGMSFALFTPEYVDAKTLVKELEFVFGRESGGVLAGLVRIVPIERLNSLLVVTPRASYLNQVRQWVERLDLETAGSGRRLFIYPVQNGKADELAQALSDIFSSSGQSDDIPRPALAPGLEPVEIGSTQKTGEASAKDNNEAAPSAAPTVASDDGLVIEDGTSVRFIADKVNNALLIMATTGEYRMVKAALEKMDIVPLQVLIEATIAEITLTDDLQHGLQWYFKNSGGSRTGSGVLDLGSGLIGGALPAVPVSNSFSYSITSAGAVRALLTAKATESKVDIISSPSLMVLNNQKAVIQVGDEVAIQTQGQSTTGGTVLNSFEYRTTGIMLSVTPRVNAGGLITMEIEQEASNIGTTTGVGGNPTITQRKIQSVIAVQSGETVVLGGLIDERKEDTRRGVPVLHTLPVVGHLFGETVDNSTRKELVVLLTPRALNTAADAKAVTEEFRNKMQGLRPFKVRMREDNEYPGLKMERSIQR